MSVQGSPPARGPSATRAGGNAGAAAGTAPSPLAALVCLLLGAGMAVYAAMQTRALPTSQRVWSEGVEATDVETRGEVKAPHILSWMVPLYSYRLKSRFIDAQGATHQLDEDLESYFERIDTSVAPAVRYDPADPSLAVSSWAASLEYGPKIAAGWGFVAGGLMVFFALRLLSQARRSRRDQ